MKQYTGTKTLMAKPMTRGEYNALREWKSIPGEDQEAPGYLVEYEDRGTPNHEDFKGYISWSPAEVFEKIYWPSASPKDRLEAELRDLKDRTEKLNGFLQTQAFKDLPSLHGALLVDQHYLMLELVEVLNRRLELWK